MPYQALPHLSHPRPSRVPAPRSRAARWLPALALLVPLALTACGGGAGGGYQRMAVPQYPDGGFVWCVPYARYVSGVQIHGDANTWWDQARGRYAQGNRPALGAVLTLRPDNRLRGGHVAVVTGLVGDREIRVSHANWGWNDKTRGLIYEDMPAVDVSPANDWTMVRFMHPSVGGYGRGYPAYGFIYGDTYMAQR